MCFGFCHFHAAWLIRIPKPSIRKDVDCCRTPPAKDGEFSMVLLLGMFCLSTCKVAAGTLDVQPVNLPLHLLQLSYDPLQLAMMVWTSTAG